jgi:long-chain acyl-CoA synthetase
MSRELWDLLQVPRQAFASRPMIRLQDREISFDEVFRSAEALSGKLARAGVQAGDPVALSLPNRPAFLAGLLAAWNLGAPVALVSPKYSSSELGAIVRGAGVSTFIATTAHAQKIVQVLQTGRITALGEDDLSLVDLSPKGKPQNRERRTEGAALLKFTSGSTGEPKGIALGPDQVRAEAMNVVGTLGLTPDDHILAAVPIFHSYGFDLGVLAALISGAQLVLEDFFVPSRIASDLRDLGITVFLGVPNMYRRWIEHGAPTEAPVPGVRYLLSCTAPLDVPTIQAFHERFHMPLCQHYGSSETGAVTNHVPSEVMRRPQSIGLPMRHVGVRLCDANGNDVVPGEEGEIVVESKAMARGYLMGAPEDRQPFRPEGFWTGDLAVQDEAGYVTLLGRVDHIINVGGFKVSPDEVRQVLESHPAVREAGAVGVCDRSGETVVAAMVALRTEATEKELIAFCYGRLADYKVPRRIHLRDELPRGPSGKVRLEPEDTPV